MDINTPIQTIFKKPLFASQKSNLLTHPDAISIYLINKSGSISHLDNFTATEFAEILSDGKVADNGILTINW